MATMNEYFLTNSEGEIIQELNAENDDVAKRACYSLAHELSDYVTCVRHICMAGPDDILRDAAEHCVEQTETGIPFSEADTSDEERSVPRWQCVCGQWNEDKNLFCWFCEAER